MGKNEWKGVDKFVVVHKMMYTHLFLINFFALCFMRIALRKNVTITSHVVLIKTLEFNASQILPLLAAGSKYEVLNW